MKKTFLAKRNSLLSGRNISWGAGALLVVLFISLIRFLAPNLFWQVFTPVFRVSDALAAESHTFLSSFGNAAELAALNEKKVSENAALANANQTLLQKVSDLESLLGTSATQREIPGILVGVVARPPTSPYDTLVLASGKKKGVALGQEVFGESGMPIGIISAVQSDFSRATLFSASGMTMDGWVGHTSIPITLAGAGAGALQATIARAANIAVGDIVFVPGPGMLPIGSVVRIDSDPLSPGVTLRIQLASNPFETSWVMLRETGVEPLTFATSTAL